MTAPSSSAAFLRPVPTVREKFTLPVELTAMAGQYSVAPNGSEARMEVAYRMITFAEDARHHRERRLAMEAYKLAIRTFVPQSLEQKRLARQLLTVVATEDRPSTRLRALIGSFHASNNGERVLLSERLLEIAHDLDGDLRIKALAYAAMAYPDRSALREVRGNELFAEFGKDFPHSRARRRALGSYGLDNAPLKTRLRTLYLLTNVLPHEKSLRTWLQETKAQLREIEA